MTIIKSEFDYFGQKIYITYEYPREEKKSLVLTPELIEEFVEFLNWTSRK